MSDVGGAGASDRVVLPSLIRPDPLTKQEEKQRVLSTTQFGDDNNNQASHPSEGDYTKVQQSYADAPPAALERARSELDSYTNPLASSKPTGSGAAAGGRGRGIEDSAGRSQRTGSARGRSLGKSATSSNPRNRILYTAIEAGVAGSGGKWILSPNRTAAFIELNHGVEGVVVPITPTEFLFMDLWHKRCYCIPTRKVEDSVRGQIVANLYTFTNMQQPYFWANHQHLLPTECQPTLLPRYEPTVGGYHVLDSTIARWILGHNGMMPKIEDVQTPIDTSMQSLQAYQKYASNLDPPQIDPLTASKLLLSALSPPQLAVLYDASNLPI